MVEYIVDARYHLTLGQREGEGWVEYRELRHDLLAEDMTDLQLLLMVGDDRAGVHLRTRTRHGEDAPYRHYLAVRLLKADVILLPGIVIAVYRYRYSLGVVTAGAAAYSEEQIDIILSCYPDALTQLFGSRVGHNAGVLYNGLAVSLEYLHDRVIHAVTLDRAASVDQLYGLAVFRQLIVEILQRVISEIQLGSVLITEIT